MTVTDDVFATITQARATLYKATLDGERPELTDVILALDEAIRHLRAKHSQKMHELFSQFLASK